MRQIVSASAEGVFENRKAGLVAFGIDQILLGLASVLLARVMAVQADRLRSPTARQDVG
jgi:hypothetical protein